MPVLSDLLPEHESDAFTDALVAASRALLATAARSLGGLAEEVTLPQYRALVVLGTRGPHRLADLAEALGVSPSTATRMCDRLLRKRLVRRHRQSTDRRTVRVALSPTGRSLVDEVTERRRAELRDIVARMPTAERPVLIRALRAFATAADEPMTARDEPETPVEAHGR